MRKILAAIAALLCSVTIAHATPPAFDGNSGWTVDCGGGATNQLVLGALTTSNTQDAIILHTGVGSVAGGYIIAISDTAGLTWKQRAINNDATDWAEEWWAEAPAALTGDVITLTFGQNVGGGCFAAIAFGISGAQYPVPFDPLYGSNATATYGNVKGSFTTKGTDDLLIVHYGLVSCPTGTNGTGWTMVPGFPATNTENVIEYQTENTTVSGLVPTITGCGGSVDGGLLDAFVASDGLLTIEEHSKGNTYVVEQTGMASSKMNSYVVVEPAAAASKLNSYIILKATGGGGSTANVSPFFHSFPP